MFSPLSSSLSRSVWSSRRSRLARFVALPPSERHLVATAALLLPSIKLLLAVSSPSVALRVVRRRRRGRSSAITVPRLAALLAATADGLPIRTSCLERSLAAVWFLCRRGEWCRLVIESCVDRQPFEAHAWVATATGAFGRSNPHAIQIAQWMFEASE